MTKLPAGFKGRAFANKWFTIIEPMAGEEHGWLHSTASDLSWFAPAAPFFILA
jgi:hypothetical protein